MTLPSILSAHSSDTYNKNITMVRAPSGPNHYGLQLHPECSLGNATDI